ncbi:MAG TPA: hypothetical protein VIG71_05285 [Enteractinococcus sp.]
MSRAPCVTGGCSGVKVLVGRSVEPGSWGNADDGEPEGGVVVLLGGSVEDSVEPADDDDDGVVVGVVGGGSGVSDSVSVSDGSGSGDAGGVWVSVGSCVPVGSCVVVGDGSSVAGTDVVHSPVRDFSCQSSTCTVAPALGESITTEPPVTSSGGVGFPLRDTVSSSKGISAGKSMLAVVLRIVKLHGMASELLGALSF